MSKSTVQLLALNLLIGGALALAPQRWLDAMSSLPAKLHAAANAQSQTNPYETGSYVFAYDAVLREVRVPDVTLTFSRVSGEGKLPAPVKTDQNGQWKQSGFELGTTYRVTPSLADYVFLPPAKEFNNSLEVGINPIRALKTTPFDLEGRVVDGRGQPVQNVAITIAAPGTDAIELRTDANGVFKRSGLPVILNGQYTLTALKSDLVFSPSSFSFQRSDQQIKFIAAASQLSVVSAATFQARVAPGSLAVVFGNDLGTQAWVSPHFLNLSVSPPGASATVSFASPTQINLAVPMMYVPVPSWFVVRKTDGTFAAHLVELAFAAPGLFTANANGRGVAAASALRIKPDNSATYEPVAEFDPATQRFIARPIDLGPETDRVYLVLFGTGMQMQTASSVKVSIGGQDAPVLFAGPQPQFAGLDQINAQLPRTLLGRGEMDLIVTASGIASNTVRISIK
ncbi:MAG TPA: carboxypeptidase regulatory-like domain-containing protein [Blastocatellia bacterium]|nr:carboxypeptidase regulatory-like domain-containing protein [Blastocatellia bacterium]HMY72685.1 carboxypeptidase regulatory-like domain-containing protein [Blastocatellia bacterium]HMZ20300.1 carboxypeptidase regulatory-like domain-containing protein [Blastocatellia bacterium]HNG28787.1 carboxypeptidase regulatory-like domain-containing protein [Blastocatellia bacterium]